MQAFMDVWPVIAFMAVQTVAAIWWAATITARVHTLERDVEGLGNVGEKIATLSGKIDALAVMLKPRGD